MAEAAYLEANGIAPWACAICLKVSTLDTIPPVLRAYASEKLRGGGAAAAAAMPLLGGADLDAQTCICGAPGALRIGCGLEGGLRALVAALMSASPSAAETAGGQTRRRLADVLAELAAAGLDSDAALEAAIDARATPGCGAGDDETELAASSSEAAAVAGGAGGAPASSSALPAACPRIIALGFSRAMLEHDEQPLPDYPTTVAQPASAEAAAAAAAANALADASDAARPHRPVEQPFPVRVHPERSDRLRAIAGLLVARGLWRALRRVREREASAAEMALACDGPQLEAVAAAVAASDAAGLARRAALMAAAAAAAAEDDEAALVAAFAALETGGMPRAPPGPDGERIGDLYFSPASLRAAKTAVATLIDVTRAVVARRASAGLALVRPPGHHASCARSAGFCVFNSVAAAAFDALRGGGGTALAAAAAPPLSSPPPLSRILIFDWDVHHGDGTERVYYADSRVLYMSIHRHDDGTFYPGTGARERVGAGAGKGFNVNIPLRGRWYGDADYARLFEALVLPIARAFRPELVLVSAGFDAARGDALGGFDLTPAAYARMTRSLASLGAPLVVGLEGGYNLAAIALSAEAVTRALLHPADEAGEGGAPLGVRANRDRDADIAARRERCGACGVLASCDACDAAHALARSAPRAGTERCIAEVVAAQSAHWPVLLAQARE